MPPPHPCPSANIPLLTDMWQHFASMTVMVTVDIGRLALLYIPKISHYFILHFTDVQHYYMLKNLMLLSIFFSKTIIP
jgi:hypothetical protein